MQCVVAVFCCNVLLQCAFAVDPVMLHCPVAVCFSRGFWVSLPRSLLNFVLLCASFVVWGGYGQYDR